MNQEQVRSYVERYLSAFSAHVMESHPDYLTVKLPEEVDKDIGNRPFYWSWVEKMNLPPQPMVLTFYFDPERAPEGMRAEHLHFGANRLQQIFQSARKHGRFVCMYEQLSQMTGGKHRRSHPLTPWLGLNLKISQLCDKRRDILLYLGVNLHQPRIVRNFYPFVRQFSLSPAIPDYCYTLERRISLQEAFRLAEQEVRRLLAREDERWANEARTRLAEELAILEAYYKEIVEREHDPDDEETTSSATDAESDSPATDSDSPAPVQAISPAPPVAQQPLHATVETAEEFPSSGGRILDFLRMNSIPVTPREEINQQEWRKSTPQEEMQRRMAELRWQYEPRIEVQIINGGLFYLHSIPPLHS